MSSRRSVLSFVFGSYTGSMACHSQSTTGNEASQSGNKTEMCK